MFLLSSSPKEFNLTFTFFNPNPLKIVTANAITSASKYGEDEFKASTIAGKYALIIGDPESGEILDILPSRLQDYIYHYFNTIDKSERLSVEYVVTDLFESYRTICKNLFWKSIHIADRFHWIRLTTEAFNKTRISIMNNILKSKVKDNDKLRYAAIIKKYYKIKFSWQRLKDV